MPKIPDEYAKLMTPEQQALYLTVTDFGWMEKLANNFSEMDAALIKIAQGRAGISGRSYAQIRRQLREAKDVASGGVDQIAKLLSMLAEVSKIQAAELRELREKVKTT